VTDLFAPTDSKMILKSEPRVVIDIYFSFEVSA
jgi:hypothetical protein